MHVVHIDSTLRFGVTDDGAPFDPAAAGSGHGFVNMHDRLGAVGGTLEVTPGPGGTTIAGTISVGTIPVGPNAVGSNAVGSNAVGP